MAAGGKLMRHRADLSGGTKSYRQKAAGYRTRSFRFPKASFRTACFPFISFE